MSFYIVLRGPAGSGKTTVSEKLTKLFNAHYISVDKIKHDSKLKHSEKESLQANSLVIQKAKKCLENNEVVIIDGVFYYESLFRQLSEELQFRQYLFSLDAPIEVCLKRNENRRYDGKRKMSDDDVLLVHRLVSEYRCGIYISTHNRSIDETLSEILLHLPKP